MRYYVSQVVTDHSTVPPRTGYMHFVTDNPFKARAEALAGTDDHPRYLLAFDRSGHCVDADGAPAAVIESAQRKEAQRVKLERQADG